MTNKRNNPKADSAVDNLEIISYIVKKSQISLLIEKGVFAMKIIRFQENEIIRWGILTGDLVQEISGDIYGAFETTNRTYPLGSVTLLAPCTPTKGVCVGLNYYDHAKEMNLPLPEEPLIFLKPSSALNHPQGIIRYPSRSSNLHFEGELAVVIKKEAWGITPEEAPEYILGYTCGNDVTARDLQMKDGQWTRGKSFDTFMPLGPVIETNINGNHVGIRVLVNGMVKQSSNTKHFIFNIPYLVAYISQVMTLYPGDVILTGTPAGVGPLAIGDQVTVEIEGIGSLVNTVATGK